MQNLLSISRPKGHCIQVTAYMDHEGTIYYSPEYSLCVHAQCITLTREIVKVFSEHRQMELLVCPDCAKIIRELNDRIVIPAEG